MKVTRDNESPIEITFSVELDAEDENPFLERSYRRTVSRLNIPGFRRGKAPRRIVESMVGRTALLQEALDFMVPETLDRVLADESVAAFGEPDIEVTDLEPVSFKATVPLEPVIDLGDYLALRVEPTPLEVNDEEVEALLDRLRDEQAVWEPVDRPAEYGDRLNIDVHGEIDSETVVEDEDIEYVPQEDNVLPFPGFAPHLVGMVEDEEREFTVTIPEDYPREQFAGKDVAFKVTVLSVKQKDLPELDDDFAMSLGEDYEDLDSLRSGVRESMLAQAEVANRNDLEQKSLEALRESAIVNASPLLYQRELELMQSEREQRLQQQGLDLATYLRFMGRTVEEYLEELRPDAERRLVLGLVLRKLAEVEEIDVTDEDLQAETERLIELSTTEETDQAGRDNLMQFLSSEASRNNIRSSLHSRRVLERLTDITQGKDDEPAAADDSAAAAAPSADAISDTDDAPTAEAAPAAGAIADADDSGAPPADASADTDIDTDASAAEPTAEAAGETENPA